MLNFIFIWIAHIFGYTCDKQSFHPTEQFKGDTLMKIQFLGAAGQVTGSMTLLQHDGLNILVDSGQFQGTPTEEALNTSPFPFKVSEIHCIILTHAHIDHSGRIPLLVKQGFTGKIFCTPPTSHLAEILLKDSGKIHETEAAWENKKRKRAGLDPIAPLFTEEDAILSFQYLYPIQYHVEHVLTDNFKFTFKRAGHLLGSSTLVIQFCDGAEEKVLVFSGDLGNGTNLLEQPPETVEMADIVIMESTYGNRVHENIETRTDRLVDILVEATLREGTVLIPSFAVGRTQEIIFELNRYFETHDNPQSRHLKGIPIYIDSPLALEATKIYEQHIPYMGDAVLQFPRPPFKMPNLHLVTSAEGSITLNRDASPKIIISASGMCEAGRITHHLKHHLWRQNTHVLFIGYQAEGTLGRRLLDGEKTVTILDSEVKVNARLHDLQGFSGHADETHLIAWFKNIKGVKRLLINHGEAAARLQLKVALETSADSGSPALEIHLPDLGETYEI